MTCEWMAVHKPKATCETDWEKQENIRLPENFKKWDLTEKLLHYTIIFNVFVFLQIWNLINARKLMPNEFNVFANFCNNPAFFVIFVISMVV